MNLNKLYESFLALKKKSGKLNEQIKKTHIKLQELRKTQEIKCECGNVTRVCDIELIREESGHWLDSNDDVRCTVKNYWVCSKCTNVLNAPVIDDLHFPSGFPYYVKEVHVWDSSRERCHGRVLEMLKPHFDREDKKVRDAEKNRKLAEARALLKEAGEL